MDFGLSEEHQLVRDSMKQCIEPFLPQAEQLRERILKHKEFPQDLWEAICETGILGCVIPEAYGGNGMGLLASAVGIEELARWGFANALLVLGTMDATAILRNGDEQIKQRYLPKIASGDQKWCFAITEPDAGSNAFRMRTIAKKDGDSYVINGSKVFITGADIADKMLMICRTTSAEECKDRGLPKTFGLSLFVVDCKNPGMQLSHIPTRGIEGMNQFMLHFDDMRVPAEDLVGQADMGSVAIFNSLNPERILASAIACGMAQFCLDRSVKYTNERKLFGNKPIGAYQAVQHPLARSKIDLEAAQLLTYRAAWSFDRDLDPFTVGKHANFAKFRASEMINECVDRCIQAHGGYGFSEEYEIIYFYEAARLLKTAPINNELILCFTAEHDLGLPRSY